MDGIDSGGSAHLLHDGKEDDDCRDRIHEGAEDDVQERNEQQGWNLLADNGTGRIQHHLGDLQIGHHVAECTCAADAQQGLGAFYAGFHEHLGHFLPGAGPVDEHDQEQRVDHGDHAALRSGENAAEHAQNDNEGNQQGGKSPLGGIPDLPQSCALLNCHALVLFGPDIGDDHNGQAHQHTGDNAAHEQCGNGNAAECTVGNHHDAGRDDGADGCGRGIDGRCHFRSITGLAHGGDHNSAQCGGVSSGGTGDTGHNHVGHHVHVSQAAGDVTHQLAGKAHQTVGDLAAIHDIAHQQKQGNGQERERVQLCIDLLAHYDGGDAHVQAGNQGGNTEAHGHGHSNQAHGKKGAE